MDSRELPIICTAPEVRAILAARQTQLRRAVKPQPAVGASGRINWSVKARSLAGGDPQDLVRFAPCPYGQLGDLLWVRETWGVFDRCSVDPFETGEVLPSPLTTDYGLAYRATDEDPRVPATWVEAPSGHRILTADERWRPSIHMPKWACRLWLRIGDVRVERLQEISEADARAEGMPANPYFLADGTQDEAMSISARANFMLAWDRRYSDHAPWASNPWVWAVTFSRVESPAEAHP